MCSPVSSRHGEHKAKLLDSRLWGLHVRRSLQSRSLAEHDYREENGKRALAYGCRRCEISVRLNAFKIQILQLLA